MAHTATTRDAVPSRTLFQDVLHDRMLVSAFVVCVVLIGYQLTVTLFQPAWIKPVTDWLRTALAWPQAAVVAWVAIRLLRTHQGDALAWGVAALGMVSYAVARTTWTIANEAVYSQGVPYPSLPDLFFMLQYPCFIVALFLLPGERRGLPGLRIMLDALLWMSAATALSWYFVLLPLSQHTGEPPLTKYISMYYQVADLVLFYGLVVALTRPQRTTSERLYMTLLSLAVIALFVADTWAALLVLHRPYTYRTGSAPDLFWFTCYLLVPLAALVRLRLAPAKLPARPPVPTWRDVLASTTFVAPSAAVVGAGVVIIVDEELRSPHMPGLNVPEAVGIALLLLAILRPAVVFLEREQLRRERDAAQAQERALRIANARMEAFLTVVAHELRTPLTSLVGNVHLMARRLDVLLRPDASREEYSGSASVLRALVARCEHSLQRMARLVEDVLDETRIHRGRLTLRLELCDLAAAVGEAVAEQVALNPEREIRWIPEAASVPVVADASRIEQVVANYVSNALKFSSEDQAVEVRLRTEDGMARLSVHDEGVGIPLAEQSHIWEQFYQAEGVKVQSSSHIGVGMGLYISKAIIQGHHGRVGIESAPDKGTTTWFTLPLASSMPHSSPQADTGSATSLPVSSEHTGGT